MESLQRCRASDRAVHADAAVAQRAEVQAPLHRSECQHTMQGCTLQVHRLLSLLTRSKCPNSVIQECFNVDNTALRQREVFVRIRTQLSLSPLQRSYSKQARVISAAMTSGQRREAPLLAAGTSTCLLALHASDPWSSSPVSHARDLTLAACHIITGVGLLAQDMSQGKEVKAWAFMHVLYWPLILA